MDTQHKVFMDTLYCKLDSQEAKKIGLTEVTLQDSTYLVDHLSGKF